MAKDLITMLLINTFDYFCNMHLKIIARIITLYQDMYSFCWYCSLAQLCLTPCDLMVSWTARVPCPSLSAQTHVHQVEWCHPTISSSVVPFTCLQSLSVSRYSPVSQLFTSGSQSIGASVSASILLMNL